MEGLNPLRGLAATICLVVMVVAAVLVQMMVFAGRDLTNSATFADAAVRAAETPAGRQGIADRVAVFLEDSLAAASPMAATPAARDLVRRATDSAINSPALRESVRTSARDAHAGFLADPARGIVIATGGLRPGVVSAVERDLPVAASFVPAAERFPALTVAVPPRAQDAARLLRDVDRLWPAAALVALGALLLGALAAVNRRRWLVTGGVILVVMAVIPWLAHLLGPSAARDLATAGYEDVAAAFAQAVTADWLVISVLTAAVGAALVAGGLMAGNRTPAPDRI